MDLTKAKQALGHLKNTAAFYQGLHVLIAVQESAIESMEFLDSAEELIESKKKEIVDLLTERDAIIDSIGNYQKERDHLSEMLNEEFRKKRAQREETFRKKQEEYEDKLKEREEQYIRENTRYAEKLDSLLDKVKEAEERLKVTNGAIRVGDEKLRQIQELASSVQKGL